MDVLESRQAPPGWHGRERAEPQSTAVATEVLVSHRVPLVRAGLVAALSTSRRLRVRARVDDLHRAPSEGSATRFDLLVTDPRSALQVLTREAGSAAPGVVAVLVVAHDAERRMLAQAWRMGVRGYATLTTPSATLVQGVEAVANGLAFCCPTVRMPFVRSSKSTAADLRTHGGLAAAALRRVREHIDHHLDGVLDLVELAAIAHLSEGHFARAFRQSIGISPRRYINIRRIALAAERILETDLPLGDIALHAGFVDQSHFTRLFASQMGESPSQFRRRNR